MHLVFALASILLFFSNQSSAFTLTSSRKRTRPSRGVRLASDESGLFKLAVPALQQLCRERGLKLGGRKAEIIDRLQSQSSAVPTASYSVPEEVRSIFDVTSPNRCGNEAWETIGGLCSDDATFASVLPGLTVVLVTGYLTSDTRILCLAPAGWEVLFGACLRALSGATVEDATCTGRDYNLAVGVASTSVELTALVQRLDGRISLGGDAAGPRLPEPGLLCLWQGAKDEVTQAQRVLGTAAAAKFPMNNDLVASQDVWLYFTSVDLFNRDPNVAEATDYEEIHELDEFTGKWIQTEGEPSDTNANEKGSKASPNSKKRFSSAKERKDFLKAQKLENEQQGT